MLIWSTSKDRHLGERHSNFRLWRVHAAVAWSLARMPSAACSVARERESGWCDVPSYGALGEQGEYRLAIGGRSWFDHVPAEKTRVLAPRSMLLKDDMPSAAEGRAFRAIFFFFSVDIISPDLDSFRAAAVGVGG